MANEFFRKPIIGGDNNAWAAYNDAYIKNAIGDYTSYLFDDSGTLKVSAGRIGINDGTNLGVSIIEETAITLSGTAGIWQKIEMTVSGTSVTFTATDIGGATNPAIIPPTFVAAYNASKGGYYMVAAARTIGVAWVDSAGDLYGVVNCKDGVYGYEGSADIGSTVTIGVDVMYWDQTTAEHKRKYVLTRAWNMDTTAGITHSHKLPDEQKVKGISAIVRNGASSVEILPQVDEVNQWQLSFSSISSTLITVNRFTGGSFDDAAWNSATLVVTLDMEEE